MSVTMAIASFIVGFTYSWKLSLVLVSVLPLLLVGAYYMITALRGASNRNREAYEKAGGIAEEVLLQMKTVASYANYEHEISRFEKKLNESLEAN